MSYLEKITIPFVFMGCGFCWFCLCARSDSISKYCDYWLFQSVVGRILTCFCGFLSRNSFVIIKVLFVIKVSTESQFCGLFSLFAPVKSLSKSHAQWIYFSSFHNTLLYWLYQWMFMNFSSNWFASHGIAKPLNQQKMYLMACWDTWTLKQ